MDSIQHLAEQINTLQTAKNALEQVQNLEFNQRFVGKCYKSMFNGNGETKYIKVLSVSHDKAYVKEIIFDKVCTIIRTDYISLWRYEAPHNDCFGWGWQDSSDEEFLIQLNKAKEQIEVD
jgi:hypothetical protein